MSPSRRSVLKGLAALLSLPMVPVLAAGDAGAIPFRTVRTLLLVRRRSQAEQDALLVDYCSHDAWKTHKVVTGRTPSEPNLPNMSAIERGTRRHQRVAQQMDTLKSLGRTATPIPLSTFKNDFDYGRAELRIAAARWRMPHTGVLLQRLDTNEWGIVLCDKREAILTAFCHDSVLMEMPPPMTPDPSLVEVWYSTEGEAVRAAGGIWWADAGRFPDIGNWKRPWVLFKAEANISGSWDL